MTRSSRRGFTLVELLIVVALIAIVSGMVVGLFGAAVDKSGATISMATQKQLVNQVNAYMQLHNQVFPDRFDSLIRSDFSGAYTPLGTPSNLPVANDLTLFISQPVAPVAGAAGTDLKNTNRGVHPDAWSGQTRTLTVTQLVLDDVRTLNNVGITTVYDHNNTAFSYGELVQTARVLAVGQPIVIVDPAGVEGQRIYKDFGYDVSTDLVTYPRATDDPLTTTFDESLELNAAGRSAALNQQRFFVLGVGIKTSLIGDGLAGVQEAPVSPVVQIGYYKHYMLAIKRGALSGNDRTPGLAGVIDPRGRGVSTARQVVNSIQ